jgi:selenophosphate synthase
LDDAGVYKISEDTAIIQTVDFITPIVNDPLPSARLRHHSGCYTMGEAITP